MEILVEIYWVHLEGCMSADHVYHEKHNMDYDSIKVLQSEINLHARLFLEVAFIAQSGQG